jgi:hypothetical protein
MLSQTNGLRHLRRSSFLHDVQLAVGRAAAARLCCGGLVVRTIAYILMLTGSVSVKLRADSAGRTISFSPV